MRNMLHLAACIIAAFALACNANATTIWTPTDVLLDGDVNIIQFDFGGLSLNGGSLALFEDTDALIPGNALVLGSGGGQFFFTDNLNGSFNVDALIAGVSQGSITMNGLEFILAVNWGSGYVGDFAIEQNPTDHSTFLVQFDDGINTGTSLAVDVQTVPLPATIWLFGSALAGMVGIKRRDRKSRSNHD